MDVDLGYTLGGEVFAYPWKNIGVGIGVFHLFKTDIENTAQKISATNFYLAGKPKLVLENKGVRHMNTGILFWIILIIIAAAIIIHNRIMHEKIAKEGITTKGRISRIDENYDDDTGNTSYTFYVNYLDENNVEREALLRGAEGLSRGEEVMIKYHPSNRTYAEVVRKTEN